MTYKYINKVGEEVEVSEEHIKTALSIKLELQEMSPSRRCNWKKHQQAMIEQGFYDGEASENYRVMIANYQRKVGGFAKGMDNGDVYAGKRLDVIQAMVGEMATEKRDNQNTLRELNKIKREIMDGNLQTKAIIEAVERAFEGYDFPDLSNISPIVVPQDGIKSVLLITDWHIGALVSTSGNKFNLAVAQGRIAQIINQTVLNIEKNGIKEIEVVYMGDLIEGSFMRASQGFDVQFNTATQINKASDLLIRLLTLLSKYAKVTYRGFSGNHDRMNQSDKGNNLHGDSVVVIANKIIHTYIEATKNPNLSYAEADYYSAVLSINGVNIKLVHGDLEKRADKGKLHDHSSRDGIRYDILAYGHFHHYAVTEIGHNRFELAVGSIKGTDDYAEKFGLESAPSQAIINIDRNGEIDIKRIGLK